jgi:hypothetical protein
MPMAPAYLAAFVAAVIVVALAAFEERRPTGDAPGKPTSRTVHPSDPMT